MRKERSSVGRFRLQNVHSQREGGRARLCRLRDEISQGARRRRIRRDGQSGGHRLTDARRATA